jgi:hypothetical protein
MIATGSSIAQIALVDRSWTTRLRTRSCHIPV